MRKLFHMPMDPPSRMVRTILAEKGLPAQLEETPPWDSVSTLAAINPAGEIPVLIDETPAGTEIAVSPALAIAEYLEEAYPDPPLFPKTSAMRAETRRLCAWFCDKFEREAASLIIRERIDKRLMRRGGPDYDRLRKGLDALSWHMDYFNWLLDHRPWFAGEKLSVADMAAAAYLSAVDYVDAAPWAKFPAVKEWYARMKSRPSMRPILRDRIAGLAPPQHFGK
jgi:glutathione S-transferase